jgi:hypothetical protein
VRIVRGSDMVVVPSAMGGHTKGAVVHDMGEVVIVGRTLGNEIFKNLNEQNDAMWHLNQLNRIELYGCGVYIFSNAKVVAVANSNGFDAVDDGEGSDDAIQHACEKMRMGQKWMLEQELVGLNSENWK